MPAQAQVQVQVLVQVLGRGGLPVLRLPSAEWAVVAVVAAVGLAEVCVELELGVAAEVDLLRCWKGFEAGQAVLEVVAAQAPRQGRLRIRQQTCCGI